MPQTGEVTKVRGNTSGSREQRDPTMTGGERAETPEEKHKRAEEQKKPKEAPIIESDVT